MENPDTSKQSGSLLAGYLSESEVAKELQLTTRTLRAWRQQRRGPAHLQVGRSVLYPREGILAWLAAQVQQAPRRK